MKLHPRILISVYRRLFLSPIKIVKNHLQFFYRFFLPNISVFYNNRINYKNKPVCSQKIHLTGLGKVSIGRDCSLGYKLGGYVRGAGIELQTRMEEAQIIIGDNVFINNNLFICSSNYIEIGAYSLIGQQVTIMDFEAHGILPEQRRNVGEIGKVILGENCWIGNNVTILKNSVIGKNSIVATGAVVSGQFPDNVIIGGIPAKILKDLPQK